MDTQLAHGLTFLAWSGGLFLVVVGGFIVKVLFDLAKLLRSINKNVDIVQSELEPIVKNVSEATTTINDIVQSTGEKINKISGVYDKASDVVVNTITKASAMSGTVLKYVFKGICSSVKYFVKK